MFVWEKIARILELSQSFDKHKNNFTCPNSGRPGGATRQGISEHSGPSMFRTRLSRSSPAISKSNRFPVVLPLLDLNSVISKVFSTVSSMGPFVGSDDHIVRVVNRNRNACRQARVHWLLASLVTTSSARDFPQRPALARPLIHGLEW